MSQANEADSKTASEAHDNSIVNALREKRHLGCDVWDYSPDTSLFLGKVTGDRYYAKSLMYSDASAAATVTTEQPPDPVNHPSHYTQSAIEPIDAIEAWGLGFNLGNAVKYIARHQHKGSPIEDLRKAKWYLDRAIQRMEEGA